MVSSSSWQAGHLVSGSMYPSWAALVLVQMPPCDEVFGDFALLLRECGGCGGEDVLEVVCVEPVLGFEAWDFSGRLVGQSVLPVTG